MNEDVRAHLEKLRAEVESLSTDKAAELNTLLDQIEADLASETQETDTGVLGAARELVKAFEVEHPKITSVLNDLLVKLESMGI